MPRFGPIKRQDLIRALRQLGFEGPYSGTRHQFMIKGTVVCVFLILTAATLALIYWLRSCAKAGLIELSGNACSWIT
jgi:hypothetical protein